MSFRSSTAAKRLFDRQGHRVALLAVLSSVRFFIPLDPYMPSLRLHSLHTVRRVALQDNSSFLGTSRGEGYAVTLQWHGAPVFFSFLPSRLRAQRA
jgi:hypothetical protein